MPTRHELPWEDITIDVALAIDLFNQHRPFINCWHIGNFIFERQDIFPTFSGVPEIICKSRVCSTIRKLGWKRFNRVHGKRSPVFIDPRVPV